MFEVFITAASVTLTDVGEDGAEGRRHREVKAQEMFEGQVEIAGVALGWEKEEDKFQFNRGKNC